MLILTIGVLLWVGIHLAPSLAQGFRQSLINRVGYDPYRGLFSLAILAALTLIVLGWRSAQPVSLYLPASGLRHLAMLGTVLALLLVAASVLPTRLRRLVRHPQLGGVLLWALSHLLVNGDSRSVVLFGGMAIWAAVAMPLISAREGAWTRPLPPPWPAEILWLVAGLLLAGALAWAHPWFTGMPVV